MIKFCKQCQAETERNMSGRCKPCCAAISAKWYAANRERSRARTAAWRAANPEKDRAINAKWRAANPEKVKAANAAWSACRAKMHAANPDKRRASAAAWHAANPGKVRAIRANRRARKRNAEGTHTAADIETLLTLQKGKCACCKTDIKDGYHVDHIMPLVRDGSNDRHNLQLLCQPCNLSKHAKHPIDFMQQLGFLL